MENNKLLLIIAVVAGVFATGLAFVYIQNTTANAIVPVEGKTAVLRVVNDLPANHAIDPDRDLVEDFVPSDTFASFVKTLVKSDERESLRGARVGMPVAAGAPLLYAHLTLIHDTNLSPGTRALGISVKGTDLMGGLLLPGDRVDIVATFRKPKAGDQKAGGTAIDPNNPASALGAIFDQIGNQGAGLPDEFEAVTILTNVRIIGVGSSLVGSRQQFMFGDVGGGKTGNSVITIEVTPDDALGLIKAAAASKDNLSLLLRPSARTGIDGTQGG